MLIKVLLVVYLINQVSCIFEDQAGTYDWRQQYVGRPLFSRIDANKNKIFLATDQRLLVALNRKTGNIVWRKIFENKNTGDVNHVIWGNNEIVAVNENGRHVQAFNYNHGYLTWEFILFKNNSDKSRFNGFESKIEAEAYYLTNGYELCYLNSKDKSCADLPTDAGHVFDLVYETDHGVFAIGKNDKSIIKIQFNGLLNIQLSKNEFSLPAHWKNLECFTVESAQLQCLVNNQEIQISDIKVSNLQFSAYKLPFKTSENSKLVSRSSRSLVIEDNSKLYILQLKKEAGTYETVKTVDDFVSYYTTTHEDEQFLVVSKRLGSKVNFYVFSVKTGAERTDLLTSITQNESKSLLFLDGSISESKAKQATVNHFCFYEDHSMVFYAQSGSKLFAREEALASIITVEMIDFPLTTLQEEYEDEFGTAGTNLVVMLFKRLKSQFFQLKEFIGESSVKLLQSIKSNKQATGAGGDANKEILLSRDEFNLNKLIVVVTSVGKIFGIHSSNGQIVWSFYLVDSTPFNSILSSKVSPLFVQRSAAHYPHDAQCAFVAQLKSDESKTLVVYFNPLNGLRAKDYQQDLTLDYKVKQVYLANIADNQFLKPLILFDTDKKMHVLPKASEDLVLKSKKPYNMYIADKSSLAGYIVSKTNTAATQLWNINLEDETIVSIGSKLHNDRVHSHGKVLGDRSVLYKYLNPNMIAVVTEGLDSQKVPFLNVYIIDTVNGNVITSFNHKRSRGPVHIVHSENCFFFSYYNIKFRRNEVTSVELFEGANQYNSTHFSSFDAIKVVVSTKSYIVQKSFDAMQITVTEKGITTKDVIVATPFGTIIEIPWILIDARRPTEMTETDREEGLIPYMPEIPLNYEFSLNYYNYVYNIRGIATSPTGLESTSLVFVYGLDIFFTRVFPSKTFDMLREDFDYFFIITLMFGLLLGTLVSKKLASSSNLSKAWK